MNIHQIIDRIQLTESILIPMSYNSLLLPYLISTQLVHTWQITDVTMISLQEKILGIFDWDYTNNFDISDNYSLYLHHICNLQCHQCKLIWASPTAISNRFRLYFFKESSEVKPKPAKASRLLNIRLHVYKLL